MIANLTHSRAVSALLTSAYTGIFLIIKATRHELTEQACHNQNM